MNRVDSLQVLMLTLDTRYIDRRILLEAKSLIKHGCEVTILSPSAATREDLPDSRIRLVSIEGMKKGAGKKTPLQALKRTVMDLMPVRLHPLMKKLYFSLFDVSPIPYFEEMVAIGKELPADIIFAHDLPVLPCAWELAQERGAHLVYDAHEFYLGQTHVLTAREIKILAGYEKELIRKTDLNITVNDDIADVFSRTYGIEKPLVIYNAVDWEKISGTTSSWLHKKLGLSCNARILLYQGGFMPGRNLDCLVRMGGYLDDDTVIVFVGWGDAEVQLRRLARKKGLLDKKVYFIAKVPYKELRMVTASATAGLIPYPPVDLNTQYCTPNKLFEFITTEVPIAYNKGLKTVEKIVDRELIGFGVPFGVPAEAARIILDCLESETMERFRVNLRLAGHKYSWEEQESRFITRIGGIMNSGRRKFFL